MGCATQQAKVGKEVGLMDLDSKTKRRLAKENADRRHAKYAQANVNFQSKSWESAVKHGQSKSWERYYDSKENV